MRFEQLCDAADLAFHGLAARLGGVCSEHRVEFEAFEQLLGLGRTHFGDELVVGLRHLVHRIDGLGVVDLGLALMEHGHTVVLLAQIRQVEVRGERAGEQLSIVQIHRIDRLDGHL